MKFSSATKALYWYCEALITLCHASSADVFCEKIFSFTKGRKVNLHRIDTMATVGYYISKLSKTCVFIIGCRYMENMGSVEIAKALNRKQNTKKFYPKLVDKIHYDNMTEFELYLTDARMISNGRKGFEV